jgi:alkylresorcinol/alkylpyrone synthase
VARSARITGIGTAVPPLEVSQRDALSFYLKNFPLKPATRVLAERVFRHPSVQTRRFAVDALEDILAQDLNRTQARFQRAASALAGEALKNALRAAGLTPDKLDFLAAATCTGYLCPGIASYAAEAVGLRSDILYMDMAGMGCAAALPALQAARGHLAAHPGDTAAVICVEIGSAAFYSDDDMGLVVSNAIFADGAAAAVLKDDGPGPRILDAASFHAPQWREEIRFRTDNGRLRNVLLPTVPARSAEAMERLGERLLSPRGLKSGDIPHWALHPGGAKVLDAIAEKLPLSAEKLDPARGVLRQFGNMSSPSCLFVLKEVLKTPPRPGDLGVLAAFGAGFSAHAALLEF